MSVYRVNVINIKGKEVWRYCYTIKAARRMQIKAIEKGINSIIFQKRDNEYEMKSIF